MCCRLGCVVLRRERISCELVDLQRQHSEVQSALERNRDSDTCAVSDPPASLSAWLSEPSTIISYWIHECLCVCVCVCTDSTAAEAWAAGVYSRPGSTARACVFSGTGPPSTARHSKRRRPQVPAGDPETSPPQPQSLQCHARGEPERAGQHGKYWSHDPTFKLYRHIHTLPFKLYRHIHTLSCYQPNCCLTKSMKLS